MTPEVPGACQWPTKQARTSRKNNQRPSHVPIPGCSINIGYWVSNSTWWFHILLWIVQSNFRLFWANISIYFPKIPISCLFLHKLRAFCAIYYARNLDLNTFFCHPISWHGFQDIELLLTKFWCSLLFFSVPKIIFGLGHTRLRIPWPCCNTVFLVMLLSKGSNG